MVKHLKISVFKIFLLLILPMLLSAHPSVPVFVSGTEGYQSFRIPAIIQLPNQEILAFAEGRVNNAGDFGHIKLVMKRSKDAGKTWSALQVVAENDLLQAGNPAPVVDLLDPAYPKGKIYLFYNTGNHHEGEIRKGNGIREVWFKTSVDGGRTWSEAVNITTQVHRPKQPAFSSVYNFPQDWRSYANTPGHAMQFTGGKYKGRIYIAANHSSGEPKGDFSDYQAHGFYTDDHGQTFHLSDDISVPGSNEATAAEISGGRLMMNIRNQRGDIRQRIVATSKNGGQHWDTTYFDKQLPDPVCEGSILTIGKKNGKNILAFCNAADPQKRDHLTLRISFDDGNTWSVSKIVDESTSGQADYTAYSDIVQLSKQTIGVLYEQDNYRQIVFKKMLW